MKGLIRWGPILLEQTINVNMIKQEEITRIGKFQKAHGLKGELNTILDIDPEYFNEGNPMIVDIEGLFVPFYTESVRNKGNISYLVKLEGIASEKEASQFVNQEIFMLTKDRDKWLDNDEFYIDSFIGYEVVDNEKDNMIGKIIGIDDTTDNVLFQIKKGDETILIPVVDEFIVDVDEENMVIKMKLPEGLVDLNFKGEI